MKQKSFLGKLIAVDMYNCGTEEVATPAVAEEKLRQGCAEYFTTPPEGQLPEWKWSGSEGEGYCNVYYFFHPGFGLWLPSQIELYNEAAYKALPKQ